MTLQAPMAAGQLLMVDIPGPTLDANTAAYLRQHAIRAVCLFGKNVHSELQLRALCADLRAVMGEQALIAIDHEGGAIIRGDFWSAPPSAMSLGRADDVQLTEGVYAALGRQLRSVGINWDFAPVLDVNVNPANPVIGERSFGAAPQGVARHGAAALRGLSAAGVAGCTKHFPGHGDTATDSHWGLPRVSKSLAELQATELLPFCATLSHAPAIMTAHIIYDALDAVYPATLSPNILNGLLRRDWGYSGVIITDSMGMQAIDAHYGRGEAAVQSLRAGADMVMALGRREVQLQTLAAVQGALKTLDAAPKLERLSQLVARFPAEAEPQAAQPGDAALLAQAWERGVNVVGRLPSLAPGSRVLLVAQRQVERETVSEASVDAQTLQRELSEWYDVQLRPYDALAELSWPELRAQAQQQQRALLLITTSRRLAPELQAATPDLHVALYNPYAAELVQAPAVQTYGFRLAARQAAYRCLRAALT